MMMRKVMGMTGEVQGRIRGSCILTRKVFRQMSQRRQAGGRIGFQ